MKYRSTLGRHQGLSFREALLSTGFMSDGGLLMPETVPTLDTLTIERWSTLKYQDLVFEISSMFVSEEEIPRTDLRGMIKSALSTFTREEVLPVKTLSNGIRILEMFHGKTWAFKDLALSCVSKFLDYFMKKDQKRVIIIVGTSGDTGSAVLEAVRGLDNVDCVILLPRGRCSQIQERQMTSVIGKNVHVFRVDGNSDDLDVPIKECFMDTDFATQHNLISVNSINWARIMVQIAHHFYAYFRTCDNVGDQVEIVVPTGAMGNVMSGIIAYKMGLPVRFVTAVTNNDVVDHMIKTGDVEIKDDVIETLATAMNIANPYNVQRLLSVFGKDEVQLNNFMNDLDHKKSAKIADEIMTTIRQVITSYQGNDDIIRKTIERCYHDDQYILCPHTALAVAYCYDKLDNNGKRSEAAHRICLATASPYKFPEAVTSSGITLPTNDEVDKLLAKPVQFTDMELGQDWTAILRERILQISQNKEGQPKSET